ASSESTIRDGSPPSETSAVTAVTANGSKWLATETRLALGSEAPRKVSPSAGPSGGGEASTFTRPSPRRGPLGSHGDGASALAAAPPARTKEERASEQPSAVRGADMGEACHART